MNLNQYQRLAMGFARYATPDYPFLALSEEVGETLGKLAKYTRKNGVTLNAAIKRKDPELYRDLAKELGDVLWQLSACCHELGFNLGDIANENIVKLSGRDERGTIVGSGDER